MPVSVLKDPKSMVERSLICEQELEVERVYNFPSITLLVNFRPGLGFRSQISDNSHVSLMDYPPFLCVYSLFGGSVHRLRVAQ